MKKQCLLWGESYIFKHKRKFGNARREAIFYLPKNRFLTTDLKRGKYKTGISSKRFFCGVKTEKRENLRFTGRRIETPDIF